ncbi:MAG: Na/Pi symporter, partial [Acidaminococcaceae bacterium]|nr:Na/Pi symporter [Acidaminococcaceae bacterium]
MIVHLFAFLGGVGLFLYGMELLGGGLQQAAGARLQKVLQSLTGVPVMGVLLGALVAATLQSSAATTVMSVGLVNAGVMTLKQAFSVVMGANIGTTFTAQLIAFKLTDYFTVMIFVGAMTRVL